MNETEKQLSVIEKNTAEIIEERELKEKISNSLEKNIPLRIKYGIDPTAPEIHLGHTVPIKKLRDFQDLGHRVLFLIGDFTARIGDPTGRNETRPILSVEQIQSNLSRYREQAGKILDLSKTEFVYNSEWLSKLTLEEVIKLTSVFTIAQILEREDFSQRYRSGRPICLQEFLYPLLQGYDSYALNADIEIGATEQKFNLLAGRTIQDAFGQQKQVVITMPILVGTDGGRKMSKTYNNHIPIEISADEMFGKVMSIPDGTMEEYFRLLTGIAETEFREIIKNNPRQAKGMLAKEIVKNYFGAAAAEESEKEFEKIFREKQAPSDIPEFTVGKNLLDSAGTACILDIIAGSGLLSSKAEAKRMVVQNAVKLDNQTISDPSARIAVKDGQVLKVGKRKFIKLTTGVNS
ncbi:MAG: tyrosine--tRNA ligase [Candidatus Omnitrophica bacterium]|nr:tyrosine--tRNA ligase [Candidatus Omnitrophota bacterium]